MVPTVRTLSTLTAPRVPVPLKVAVLPAPVATPGVQLAASDQRPVPLLAIQVPSPAATIAAKSMKTPPRDASLTMDQFRLAVPVQPVPKTMVPEVVVLTVPPVKLPEESAQPAIALVSP